MQQTYNYTRGFRILFLCLLAPFALMVPFIIFFLVTMPVDGTYYVLATALLPCMALVLFGWDDLFSVVTADNYGIRYKSPLFDRELLWQDIKGFRWGKNELILAPGVSGKRRIKVSAFRKGYATLANSLTTRYQNLNVLEAEMAMNAIKTLNGDINRRMKMARYSMWTLNTLAIGVPISTMVAGGAGSWLMVLLMLVPIVTFMLMEYHKGLIVLTGNKEEIRPGAIIAIIVPQIWLFLYTSPLHIVDHTKMWLPVIMAAMALTAWLAYSSRHQQLAMKSAKWLALLFCAVHFCVGSYGSLVYFNAVLDKNKPEIYEATIINKRISRGKSTSYLLKLQPWGPEKDEKEISVGEATYNALEENDKLEMSLYKGAFDIPWYKPPRLANSRFLF
ncbi:hypothetical protein [Chitinophaga flava]|uniref:Uncharacterized protein n=1 Tax=Chitinophaga flava TaxID=2259036 RepID=A0A365XY86_9BACT|nr:hypothetical protein [Chitinophaga flava]RBL91336.1 hypothetical protein DF182_01545 [Chitinophaga flava]